LSFNMAVLSLNMPVLSFNMPVLSKNKLFLYPNYPTNPIHPGSDILRRKKEPRLN